MKVEFAAWVIHRYQHGVYVGSVAEPMSERQARRYCETYNTIHGAEGLRCEPQRATFRVEAPERVCEAKLCSHNTATPPPC